MFWSKNKKKKVYPCKPQFYYIKVGFTGVFIARTCFPDENLECLYLMCKKEDSMHVMQVGSRQRSCRLVFCLPRTFTSYAKCVKLFFFCGMFIYFCIPVSKVLFAARTGETNQTVQRRLCMLPVCLFSCGFLYLKIGNGQRRMAIPSRTTFCSESGVTSLLLSCFTFSYLFSKLSY